MNRQAGRDIDKRGIKENLGTILESDELIITPSDVTTSKYKKEHFGVSWSRDTMSRMDSNNDIQREINDDEDGKLYNDYKADSGDDIISSRREINDAGVAWKKGGDTQGRGRGRDEGRVSAVELMKELMLSDPQSNEQTLDLESDLTTQSK